MVLKILCFVSESARPCEGSGGSGEQKHVRRKTQGCWRKTARYSEINISNTLLPVSIQALTPMHPFSCHIHAKTKSWTLPLLTSTLLKLNERGEPNLILDYPQSPMPYMEYELCRLHRHFTSQLLLQAISQLKGRQQRKQDLFSREFTLGFELTVHN
jgi:hypothetical protein